MLSWAFLFEALRPDPSSIHLPGFFKVSLNQLADAVGDVKNDAAINTTTPKDLEAEIIDALPSKLGSSFIFFGGYARP
jgi:hypothetical protein